MDDLEQLVHYNLPNNPFQRPLTQILYLGFVNPIEAGDASAARPSMVEVMFTTHKRPFGTPTIHGPIQFAIDDLRDALTVMAQYIAGHPKSEPKNWPPPSGPRIYRWSIWSGLS